MDNKHYNFKKETVTTDIAYMFIATIKEDMQDVYALSNGRDMFVCNFDYQERKTGLWADFLAGYCAGRDDDSGGTETRFRKNFSIVSSEKILWARDTSSRNTRDGGTVITDRGFHLIPNKSDYTIFLPWSRIEKVETEFERGDMVFYMRDGEKDSIDCDYILKYNGKNLEYKAMLSKLADLFTDIANSYRNCINLSFETTVR